MTPMPHDSFSAVPEGTQWCPHCNGYGSSLNEESERCTRCGGSGLVLVADESDQNGGGHEPGRPGPAG
jgi:DnaJ-class molecular chaperone